MNDVIANQEINQGSKYSKLIACLILDGIGLFSYLLPFIGEFSDLLWAPFVTFIISRMFKGTIGKVMGVVTFIEEVLPGLDFIPTFTIAWFYANFVKK